MWQRVQTLFFAIVVGLMAALLLSDFARVPGAEDAIRYAEYLPYAVLAGLALACAHPAFLAVPAFVGCGLVYAGVTGTCGLGLLLQKMPWNRESGR